MQQPSILHLRASNFIGGPERQILEHFRHASGNGFRLILGTFPGNGGPCPLASRAADSGYAMQTIHSKFAFDPSVLPRIRTIIRQENVKLLVTHGYKPNVLGRIAGWLTGTPTIAVSRGWTWESRRIRLYESVDKLFLRFADHVVAVSDGQRSKLLDLGVRKDKITTIRNGIALDTIPAPSPESLHTLLELPEEAVIIASAGRLSPEKNHIGLVEAARHVCSANPDAYFVVFGEGALRPAIEKRIQDVGLQDRFLLPGFRPDLLATLHHIDIFALPSHTEGLPNVVLEAFACRKPAVVTRVGGCPEVVCHKENGFVVEPNDMEGLAKHILELANDPELRERMGAHGYARVQRDFSFDGQTRQWMNLLHALFSSRTAEKARP
ncbi:glycosyltransferase [Oceanidesulfovibrio marinus]|uniref:Group 1 glycosyl transferase n=1 Tax=Oceanidesulfovibrio marinus TaxID=370038 RepID=A0A6P1ZIH8_9BACT|nr:glycosyltransferase [Oceanidesulfovibrio marinus]TVM33456.1 group 1 glycosyl transferase [Oceanidesulfovibrio marinus]